MSYVCWCVGGSCLYVYIICVCVSLFQEVQVCDLTLSLGVKEAQL